MRADKRLTNRHVSARLRFADACIENIDFGAHHGLTGATPCHWLTAHEYLILTGQSWLACAFGRQSVRLYYSVLYLRMPRLFEDLTGATRRPFPPALSTSWRGCNCWSAKIGARTL